MNILQRDHDSSYFLVKGKYIFQSWLGMINIIAVNKASGFLRY